MAPYNRSASYSTTNGVPQPPSAAHWLGTTQAQQDVFSQLLTGGRSTMVVAFIAGLVATVLSVIIGITAGYLRPADRRAAVAAGQRVPGHPRAAAADRPPQLPAARRASNTLLIGVIIAITGWAWGARVLRAQTLSVKRRDFVEAARIIGESRLADHLAEVLPNLVAIVASSFLFTVLYAIGTYIALAYLGVTSTSVWNWGTMLYWAQTSNAPLSGAWWWFVPPGLAIALVGMGLALLNFGVDEFINPRLRRPAGPVKKGPGRAAPAPQAGPDPGGQDGRPRPGSRGRARQPPARRREHGPGDRGRRSRRTTATRYWRSAGCAWTTGGAKRPCTRWWTPT